MVEDLRRLILEVILRWQVEGILRHGSLRLLLLTLVMAKVVGGIARNGVVGNRILRNGLSDGILRNDNLLLLLLTLGQVGAKVIVVVVKVDVVEVKVGQVNAVEVNVAEVEVAIVDVLGIEVATERAVRVTKGILLIASGTHLLLSRVEVRAHHHGIVDGLVKGEARVRDGALLVLLLHVHHLRLRGMVHGDLLLLKAHGLLLLRVHALIVHGLLVRMIDELTLLMRVVEDLTRMLLLRSLHLLRAEDLILMLLMRAGSLRRLAEVLVMTLRRRW